MRILKNLFIAVIGLIAVLLVGSLFVPATQHVERKVSIDASPAELFALLNGFREFNRWSPWADIDPNTSYAYTGPDSGVGARMEWSSEDPNVGAGVQEIVASTPNELIEVELRFDSQVARSAYELRPAGNGTEVVWSFDADFGANPIGRYMGLMMDKLIGPDYEKGLGRLKSIAETR